MTRAHGAPPSGHVLELFASAREIDPAQWDALHGAQSNPTPFLTHAYLSALEESGCASPDTGWTPLYFTLRRESGASLPATWDAACVLYLKSHSYGEYVFDWAWADAYQRHGLPYYPKGVLAVPFTPVPGARLLARDASARAMLLHAITDWAKDAGLSSLHMLFADEDDLRAAHDAGWLLRHTVQFHWRNRHPRTQQPFADFEEFLASLNQEKRKKIRQERRRVAEAGVSFRVREGTQITSGDWDFFYACYERTYLEHGNAPYLSRDFFLRMQQDMPDNWVIFIAERGGAPIACSLLARRAARDSGATTLAPVAYGRYWGALERVDCLHFEACYYQPLIWCIANGVERFEGGAQGQHKMARALLPVQTSSAHWLAHPGFAQAVEHFLEREGRGIGQYLNELHDRSPFRRTGP
ncbi:GNAT family N-acetyltransferase [Diaphorobacter ruginosibacter]|uniref:GNAT family N-acetyltransferase n=1 Tax=Diaphorobacter ruginosibacter TaxID=1715720 RepID=UPI00333F3AB0